MSCKKHSQETILKMRASQNSQEVILKRMTRKHCSACNVKLTWDIVNDIRNQYIPRKITYKKLAQKYNVSQTTIKRVIKNETWIINDEWRERNKK